MPPRDVTTSTLALKSQPPCHAGAVTQIRLTTLARLCPNSQALQMAAGALFRDGRYLKARAARAILLRDNLLWGAAAGAAVSNSPVRMDGHHGCGAGAE